MLPTAALRNGLKGVVTAVMSTNKFNVVFVLGGPGAGKGTQCARIVKEYGFVHLSAGDLLRAERHQSDSQYGELINQHITNGTIVPVDITCSLLEKAMESSEFNKFLIDGFPRNKDNRDGWEEKMTDKVNLLFVLFFDCPQEVCIQRCLSRGAAGSGRADDNKQSLVKRLETYRSETMATIEYYRKQQLVETFDAARSPDEIFSDLSKLFVGLKL